MIGLEIDGLAFHRENDRLSVGWVQSKASGVDIRTSIRGYKIFDTTQKHVVDEVVETVLSVTLGENEKADPKGVKQLRAVLSALIQEGKTNWFLDSNVVWAIIQAASRPKRKASKKPSGGKR